ncbi:hypothetical protein GGR54DRAFT_630461 [Hypoxylon sp. NC1633]|nr:hypothetical protein GGR54DRAFT_630461 [Hypoxylon sp. NC1633]
MGDIRVRDVVVIGAGLAVAARLFERFETRRKSPVASSSNAGLGLLALDATNDHWMTRPMFFHIDPAERDSLLAHTYRNNRDSELIELQSCVGKELRKYQRKKRERTGRQPGTEPTVDECDRNDYFVPSTPLFASHCGCLMDRYHLRGDMVRHERIVVLAVSGNPPQIPNMPTEGTHVVTHVMQIKEMPSPRVRAKMDAKLTTDIVIIGSGLTSAQLADLAIRRGVDEVKPFDVGLKWKILDRHISSGRLCLLQNTTIQEKKWNASPTLPQIEHVYFATGIQSNFERLLFLKSVCSDYPMESCGGLLCITENMAWRDDVPLFVAGRLAALQLGPGAPNSIGARSGAEKIASSIQDIMGARESGIDTDSGSRQFNYLTGRGSRYDALGEVV